MLLQDGLPFHFTPSVQAQWEANFLDPESPEANVTAALAVAESSNLEGQGMTWFITCGDLGEFVGEVGARSMQETGFDTLLDCYFCWFVDVLSAMFWLVWMS